MCAQFLSARWILKTIEKNLIFFLFLSRGGPIADEVLNFYFSKPYKEM